MCMFDVFQNATDRAVLVNIVNIISELLGKTRKYTCQPKSIDMFSYFSMKTYGYS